MIENQVNNGQSLDTPSRLSQKGLRQRLMQSHFLIAVIGIALLIVALVSTLVLRSNAVRLAQLRGPTAQTSMLALSGANRSLAGLRGWIVLGEPRFLDDLSGAWQYDIWPAVSVLQDLSNDWNETNNSQKLQELKKSLNELEKLQRNVASVAHSKSNEPARLLYQRSILPISDVIQLQISNLIESEREIADSEKRNLSLESLAEIRRSFTLCQARLSSVIDTGSNLDLQSCCDQFDTSIEKLDEIIDQLDSLDPEQRKQLSILQLKFQEYASLRKQALEIRQSDEWNVARHLMAEECVPKAYQAISILTAMSTNQAALMRRDAKRVHQVSNLAIACSVILVFAMAVTAFIVSSWSSQQIIKPIEALLNATRQLAAGTMTKNIPIPDETELGQLTSAFNSMRVNLQQSEERFTRAIMDAPFPIIIHSEVGKIHRVNNVWKESTGFDSDDLDSIQAWFDKTMQDKQPEKEQRLDKFYKYDRRTQIGEREIVTRTGDRRIWDFSSAQLGTTGDGTSLIVSMAVDVTARKKVEDELRLAHDSLEQRVKERTTDLTEMNAQLRETEQELRDAQVKYELLLENNFVYMVAISRQGFFLAVNKQTADLISPGSEPSDLIGKSIHEVWPHEKADGYAGLIEKICETGQSQFTDTKYDLLDGELWLMTCAQPIRDENGEITGVHVVGQDITERKRLEEEALQQREKMAHVLRVNTMGEMATALAHELNQPLSAIATYSALCIDMYQDENSELEDNPLPEILEKIGEQSLRAGQIIHRLRRLVSNQPEWATFDLNESIRTVTSLLASEAKMYEVTLHLELSDDLPEMYGDSIQIEQVLLNLMHNAIEAMRDGKTKQRDLTVKTALSNNGKLEVTVSDTGPGISLKVADEMFNSFVSTKKTGMGMGLSISRSIVEMHGGQLTVAPQKECGVTFDLLLPMEGAQQA